MATKKSIQLSKWFSVHSTSKALLTAFEAELLQLGLTSDEKWNKTTRHNKETEFIITHKDGRYGFYSHGGAGTDPKDIYELPKQWDVALAAIKAGMGSDYVDLCNEVKEGTWVTVKESDHIKAWDHWKDAVGYTFQLLTKDTGSTIAEDVNADATVLDIRNKHGINYKPSTDLRLATAKEIVKGMESIDYKVGDWVTVVSLKTLEGKSTYSQNYVGKTYQIVEVKDAASKDTTLGGKQWETIYRLQEDNRCSWECPQTIRPATRKEIQASKVQPKIATYDMVFSTDKSTVNFGCQAFTKDEVAAILRLFNLPNGVPSRLTIGDTVVTKQMLNHMMLTMK